MTTHQLVFIKVTWNILHDMKQPGIFLKFLQIVIKEFNELNG